MIFFFFGTVDGKGSFKDFRIENNFYVRVFLLAHILCVYVFNELE